MIERRDKGELRSMRGMTVANSWRMPVVVDIATAASALGLGRSTGYELARRDEFPCRVLRVGSSYRVPTAELLRLLGIDPDQPTEPPAPARPNPEDRAICPAGSEPVRSEPVPRSPCSCSTRPAARKSRRRWVSTLVDMSGTRAASSR